MRLPEDSGRVSDETAKAYLREMLQLNPVWQSGLIVRRRNELLDLASSDNGQIQGGGVGGAKLDERTGSSQAKSYQSDSTVDHWQNQQKRDQAAQYLGRVHQQFYALSDSQLEFYLHFISNGQFPEFAERVQRLSEVAKQRKAIEEISKDCPDEPFVTALRSSLVAPAPIAGHFWEAYIDSLVSSRKLRHRVKRIHKIVRDYPAVYELERSWFDEILDRKNQAAWLRKGSVTGRAGSFLRRKQNLLTVLSIIAVFVISGIMSEDNDSKRTNQSRQQQSQPFRLGNRSGGQQIPSFTPQSPSGQEIVVPKFTLPPLRVEPRSSVKSIADFYLENAPPEGTENLDWWRPLSDSPVKRLSEKLESAGDEIDTEAEAPEAIEGR
ncbi:hypothetical protein LOC67_14205 [Stieleria sp. JC731]|uniref:hypothetical protein n=1 Tax=Pirellulaceae TaxID=2691357 RepID=UPI001E39F64C|nr:hypothetical protein [Stieleria sp. JC731]MCC9601708.1 hypothetical protein [Stieleria sp. JC731]